MIIRNEEERDYPVVEELTRKAFWNLHGPGCDEHYLVHRMRSHPDFIPELDFVIEREGRVVGNIMYTRGKLRNDRAEEREVLTFGPLSVEPEFQRLGLGKRLIGHSVERATELGYDFIVIFGNPGNYVGSGFMSSIRFRIYVGDRVYPTAMLARRIGENRLGGEEWEFIESDVYRIDQKEAEIYDRGFEQWERKKISSQEEFFILSHSRIIHDGE